MSEAVATAGADARGAGADLSRVTAVVICFHSEAMVAELLDSLPAEMPRIVVDNSPSDEAAAVVAARPVAAEYLHLPRNAGFGGAANAGAARAGTEFVLVMNPDVRIGRDLLDECVAIADADPAAGLIGESRTLKVARVAVTTYVNGAFLFFRKAAFDAVGGFDEDFFLYFEDTDLSVRFAGAGYRPHAPRSEIGHVDGRSVATDFDSRKERRWLYGAACRTFIDKHPWTRAALCARYTLLRYWIDYQRNGYRAEEIAGARAARREGVAVQRSNLFTGGARRTRV